jgi:hypothetical protein
MGICHHLSKQVSCAIDFGKSFFLLRARHEQLDKLEVGGILASRKVGRTRLYVFNPRYPS